MKLEPPEPQDSPALVALTDLLRRSPKRPTTTELDQGLSALRTHMASDQRDRQRTFGWRRVAVAVALCGLLGIVAFSIHREGSSASAKPVSVARIEGGKLLDGGYLSEFGAAGIKLYFNEGSQFSLAPGTRGRLRAVTKEGARLGIENGTASLEITQSPDHRWSVEAGPFLVTVKGTDFTVSWDSTSEQFELRLRRGRVSVSGPVIGNDLALSPGQKLTVSLPKGETVIAKLRPDESPRDPLVTSPPAAADASASPPAAPRNQPGVASATPAPAGTERRWREALGKGQWDRILADVEREGVDATLQTASSDDLFALADAARYRRRADLARAALLAHRRRFPGSPRSLDAVFLLGRVEELRGGGSTLAIEWYEEYLARAPSGTYAAEALGRKMILKSEVGGPASARAIAEEYLRRYPDGSHAGAARALQRGP